MTDFSLRFSLFAQQEKKSDKSPDQSGTLEIPMGAVEALAAYLKSATPETNYKDEPVVRLRMAGWSRESKGGKPYTSGLISAPLQTPSSLDF